MVHMVYPTDKLFLVNEHNIDWQEMRAPASIHPTRFWMRVTIYSRHRSSFKQDIKKGTKLQHLETQGGSKGSTAWCPQWPLTTQIIWKKDTDKLIESRTCQNRSCMRVQVDHQSNGIGLLHFFRWVCSCSSDGLRRLAFRFFPRAWKGGFGTSETKLGSMKSFFVPNEETENHIKVSEHDFGDQQKGLSRRFGHFARHRKSWYIMHGPKVEKMVIEEMKQSVGSFFSPTFCQTTKKRGTITTKQCSKHLFFTIFQRMEWRLPLSCRVDKWTTSHFEVPKFLSK